HARFTSHAPLSLRDRASKQAGIEAINFYSLLLHSFKLMINLLLTPFRRYQNGVDVLRGICNCLRELFDPYSKQSFAKFFRIVVVDAGDTRFFQKRLT